MASAALSRIVKSISSRLFTDDDEEEDEVVE